MKLGILGFSVLMCICNVDVHGKAVLINKYDVEGYYWRDYLGIIPSDAIPGGKDSLGRTTYIGNTVDKWGGMVPGKIIPTEKLMYYENSNAEHSASGDIKILCSKHPEQLQWITTKTKALVTSVTQGNKHLILDKESQPIHLAIGRKTLPTGEVEISKVHVTNEFQLMYIANNGKGFPDKGPYDVLVYDPNIVSTDSENLCGVQKIIYVNVS